VLLPVAALAIVAIPTLHLRLGLPDDSTASTASTQRKAYDQLSAGFGAGFNGPLIVVVQAATGQAATAATQARNIIAGLHDVVTVTAPTPNKTGDTAILSVIPKSGPSSTDTKTLVHAIRAQQNAFTSTTGGATLAVTGTAALNIDVAEKTGGALLPYLAVIVGLAFILLMLVFRSILVPIKATVGFLLSVAATFGAVVAVFQWGWLAHLLGVDSTGPIVSFIPIFLIGILFGLAMDYELFLVTRVREEYAHGAGPNDAVISGVKHGARVITAAALIMTSVFAGFILADDAIVKALGFALAFGVLVDAFLVRMTIVPAVLSLLGKAAWALPRWLDKALPSLDIEGEELARQTRLAPTANKTSDTTGKTSSPRPDQQTRRGTGKPAGAPANPPGRPHRDAPAPAGKVTARPRPPGRRCRDRRPRRRSGRRAPGRCGRAGSRGHRGRRSRWRPPVTSGRGRAGPDVPGGLHNLRSPGRSPRSGGSWRSPRAAVPQQG